jgi:hypothetical protein
MVYVIAMFGVPHFWWLVKKDITEPLIFDRRQGCCSSRAWSMQPVSTLVLAALSNRLRRIAAG